MYTPSQMAISILPPLAIFLKKHQIIFVYIYIYIYCCCFYNRIPPPPPPKTLKELDLKHTNFPHYNPAAKPHIWVEPYFGVYKMLLLFFFWHYLYLKTLYLWNLPGDIMSPLSNLISLDLKLYSAEKEKNIWWGGGGG